MDRSATDQRALALEAWVQAWLAGQADWPSPQGCLQVVSGDASFRRYFRQPLQGSSLIAVDAPPEKENSRPFVAIARALLAHGVQVPEVIAADFNQGFMLLSDLGDTLLLPCLNAGTVDDLYGRAMDALLHIQETTGEVPGHALPVYDQRRLLDEMGLFRDWFVGRYLGLSLNTAQEAVLENAFHLIEADARSQPQVFVHRDYHSRNLMLPPGGGIGVIDFQDAVTGPVTYDLLSLLRDAYVVWPDAQVRQWVAEFASRLRSKGRLHVSDAEFLHWFDWMGAQRHLKVVGIFARLSLRDGKHGYLEDIPRVFNYLLNEIRDYPELHALSQLLQDTILTAYLEKKPDARGFFAA